MHQIEGYSDCIQQGLKVNTWGTHMHKLINVLQSIKKYLANWNKKRIRSNSIQQLEEEYNKGFLELDANPENDERYNKILDRHLQLKGRCKQQHEFHKQQSKIIWLQSGDTNSKKKYAKMAMR